MWNHGLDDGFSFSARCMILVCITALLQCATLAACAERFEFRLRGLVTLS